MQLYEGQGPALLYCIAPVMHPWPGSGPGTCGPNGDIARWSPSDARKTSLFCHTAAYRLSSVEILRHCSRWIGQKSESHHGIRLSIVAAYQANELLGLAS
jgi:hypothetical protein